MKFLYPKVLGFLAPTPAAPQVQVEVKDDASAILNEAAHILNEQGWCWGKAVRGTRMCTLAAMYEASAELNLLHAYGEAQSRMSNQIDTGYIPLWNDSILMLLMTPYFAKKRVMRNLRKAAKL